MAGTYPALGATMPAPGLQKKKSLFNEKGKDGNEKWIVAIYRAEMLEGT